MPLFYNHTFADGGWAGEVKAELARQKVLPDWQPKGRIRRNTWHQWVQYEPQPALGPFFWSGKPAVRDATDALFVGYYVERGFDRNNPPTTLPNIPPEEIIDSHWHWHGFRRCLSEQPLRAELNALMLSLTEQRRTVWVSSEGINAYSAQYPYEGVGTLDKVRVAIDQVPADQWVNVMLGNRFSLQECLDRQLDVVKAEFRNPIIRASEIKSLIVSAMPPATGP